MRATFLVCNDDFTDHTTDLPYLCHVHHPLAWAAQEGKGRRYVIPGYGVRQRQATEATQGVAVGWDIDRARPIGDALDQPHELGHGWEAIIDGADLLTRGVVWQDLEVRTPLRRRVRIRVASFHRPPWRDRHLWDATDKRLAEWVRKCPASLGLWMGSDSNEEGGPASLVRQTHLHWHGPDKRPRSIDGALTSLHVVSTRDLPFRFSDHRPLVQTVRI